jgi:hypothetical protein
MIVLDSPVIYSLVSIENTTKVPYLEEEEEEEEGGL